ncbi:hypothetical protein N0V93_008805 [Gnomoniopsis smithogilvyi]|uniref:Uncharacterized protein n=1 Tax=Gnomoniopsis smithogilvyi TaxID=1191159 RepID=A0A9W8YNP5_9PEZI|nr:hypothetical protein N0V93_008805 [Gnomoniopsis smithogilvyi]
MGVLEYCNGPHSGLVTAPAELLPASYLVRVKNVKGEMYYGTSGGYLRLYQQRLGLFSETRLSWQTRARLPHDEVSMELVCPDIKWSFISFFILFEVGSFLCGYATSSDNLIIGRAVAGMGSAGILNGGITIITGCVPTERRAALTGTMIASE